MVLFVCMNTGWGRYALHFEDLAEDRPVPRAEREAEAGRIMQRYADRLEHYARLAPFNWFNFHDVWQVDG
jgi:predicted LPLAT superfamily acyltransferase